MHYYYCTVYNYESIFIMCSKYSFFVFVFFWCPCMAFNMSVQHNDGFLLGSLLLIQCYYHRGTCLNVIKGFRICSLKSHLNV